MPVRAIGVSVTLAAAVVWFAAASRSAADEPPITLIQDGKARALIVVPKKGLATRPELAAANILADHLLVMSGVRLAIKREDELGGVRIESGRLRPQAGTVPDGIGAFVLVGEGELAKRLGLTADGLGPGGVLVKTQGNVLALLGSRTTADPYATRHAVICLLEQLGCRYLWPGRLGKVVPRRSTVAVGPLDIRYTPKIGQRHIRFQGLKPRVEIGLERLGISKEAWLSARRAALAAEPAIEWSAWQRLGGSLGIHGGHAACGLEGGWEQHGKEHPEWFALQADGTRDQSGAGDRFRLCVSNRGLIEHVARSIIEEVNRNPARTCFSLSPNDGGYSSFCMCEDCKRLDPPDAPPIQLLIFEKVGQSRRKTIEYVSLTDRYVWYWNRVAERVTSVHPHVLFVVDAYSAYRHPPVRFKLHPNLVVRYVPSTPDGWLGWQRAGAKRIFWRPNILLAGRRTGLPIVMVQRLADTMRFLADNGMLATDFDSIIHNWSVHGLTYYAAARLNWNPYLSGAEIIDDYCHSGFGPAAESVKRYFLTIQAATAGESAEAGLGEPGLMGKLRSLLAEADRAAAGDQLVRDRIAFLRIGLNFADLQLKINRLVERAKADRRSVDRAQARRLLTLNYLMLRDIALHHHLAINTAYLMWGNGDYAAWSPIGGRRFRPESSVAERVEQAEGAMTGNENSVEELLSAFGL